MSEDQFDLAGFCVGLVRDDHRLGADLVDAGDVVVGLASSGLHSNGYSLVRDVVERAGLDLDGRPRELGGRTLADELLEPTAIYAPLLARLAADTAGVHAAAHVTGGGILPDGLGADLDTGAWSRPPVFGLLQRAGDIDDDDMWSTFNMGIGMMLVVGPDRAAAVIAAAREASHDAHVVGRVSSPSGIRLGAFEAT
jgi:phosphoribosylformylglycinamidine cyclo-ligase